jgi:hypothetical protein
MSTHKSDKHRHKHHHHHHRTHHPKRDWRDTFVKYRFGIIIASSVVLGIAVLTLGSFVAWAAYQGHLYQSVYGPELDTELGFTIDSSSIQAGDEKVDIFTIHPIPDGYMDKIGFLDGYVIASHSATEFYKMLHTQRGRTVSVDLVEGGDGVPIEARKVKTMRFLVPPTK